MDRPEPDNTLEYLAARLEESSSPACPGQTLRHGIIRRLIDWMQSGRIDSATALFIHSHPVWFLPHLPLRLLPARWHRFVCDPSHLTRHIQSRFRLLRRQFARMAAFEPPQQRRYLHVPIVVGLIWAFLIGLHQMHYQRLGMAPAGDNLWYLKSLWAIAAPLLCGGLIAGFAGGVRLSGKIMMAMLGGFVTAIVYSIGAFYLEKTWRQDYTPSLIAPLAVRLLVFIPLSGLSAAIYEYILFILRSKAGRLPGRE
ncbi:MAG: hypothetical protein ABFD91_03315 [Anaerohalosphaeraceae bacterium]